MNIFIEGFSKKNKEEKLKALVEFFKDPELTLDMYKSFDHPDEKIQELINEFSIALHLTLE